MSIRNFAGAISNFLRLKVDNFLRKVEIVFLLNKSCKVTIIYTTRRDNKGCPNAIECLESDITCVVF